MYCFYCVLLIFGVALETQGGRLQCKGQEFEHSLFHQFYKYSKAFLILERVAI
jgi:hypothetical protein